MGKKEWRESASGPDCLDVAVVMKAIATLHGCSVALIVTPTEDGLTTSVDIAMSALFDVLPASLLAAGIGAHSSYPNKKGTSFWGEVYALCWSLDDAIGKEYKQQTLREG